MGSVLVYKGCGESLKGVDPSRIHPMGCTLHGFYTRVNKGCGESLEGVDR